MHVGDLPLAMTPSPDGRFLIVSNNGWAKPTLTVVRHHARLRHRARDRGPRVARARWHPDGTRLFSSGGSQNTVNEFTWD